MTEIAEKLHVVASPAAGPAVQDGGLATVFVPRSDVGDLRWFPFPGLEHFGSEVQLRHQSCKRFAAWQKRVQEAAVKRGKVDTDHYKATLPAAYADMIVTAWRTPLYDEQGNTTGTVDGIPWGRPETTIKAAVYELKGRGVVLVERDVSFDVDAEGYLRSTRDNRERLFSAYQRVLDDMVGLATDDEAFARPDEEEIRGN